MLNIYITDEHGILKETDEIISGCWVNLVAPTEQEMNLVAAKAQIPMDFIKDPLDEEERSRIENDNSNVLIVVNLPLVSTETRVFPCMIRFH